MFFLKFCISATSILLCAATLQAGSIKITFEDIKAEAGGSIRVGLYDEKGFPDEGEELYGKSVRVKGPVATVEFEDIPAGTYAVACYQDINGDERFNRSLFGTPKEPYGFSKNKFGRLRPPDFESVAFEVGEDDSTELTIKLKS